MAVRRLAKRRGAKIEELTFGQRFDLLTGTEMILGTGFSDTNDMRAAWELHRDSLRAEWASEHAPGTRCFAEWFFEIVPKCGERPTTKYFTAKHAAHREAHLIRGIMHTNTLPEMQESEHRFLHRHGIIDDAEFQAAEGGYQEWLELHRRPLELVAASL
jgi:hypothetical protein